MPPILALAIGVGFFTWLLRNDTAFRGRMSPTLWVPFIWLLIEASRPVALWLGIGGSSEVGGNPIDRAIAFGLIFTALLILRRRNFAWNRLASLSVPFFLLLAFFAVSLLWSSFPFVAFKRWIREAGGILVVLVILTEKNPGESLKTVCVRCAYILFPLSVVLIKYYPKFGRAYSPGGYQMVTGVTDQKNSLGLICAVFALALIWDILDAHRHRTPQSSWARLLPQWVALATGLWLLVTCESKTSLFAFVIGLAIFLGPHLRMIRRVPVFFAKCSFIAVAAGLIITVVWTVAVAPFLAAMGRDATFTERTDIWRVVLEEKTNPVVGAGFYSFWLDKGEDVLEQFGGNFSIKSAHNGYLEMYLDGGIIGCALLFAFLLTTNLRLAAAFSYDNSYARALFALAIMSLVMNFAESYFFRLDVAWFTLLLGALSSRMLPFGMREPNAPAVHKGPPA